MNPKPAIRIPYSNNPDGNHEHGQDIRLKGVRGDIQLLRFFAVIAVVLFHATQSLLPNGYLGVDAFFVISGYLIVNRVLGSFGKSTNSLKSYWRWTMSFWVGRIIRLGPAMIVTLAVTLVFTLVLADARDIFDITQQANSSLLFLGNITASANSQDYFHPNPNPLLHLWSTSIEVQTYLIMTSSGVLLFALKKARRFWIILNLMIGSYSLLKFAVHIFKNPQLNDSAYFDLDLRLWEILLSGIILNLLRFPAILLLKRFSLVVLLLLLCWPQELSHSYAIVVVVFASIVFCGTPGDIISASKYNKWAIEAGNRAYSLFLVHLPILYFAKYSPVTGSSQERYLQTALSLVIAGLSAEILFRKVESRVLNTYRQENVTSNTKKLVFKHIVTILVSAILIVMVNATTIYIKGIKGNVLGLGIKPQDLGCPFLMRFSPCTLTTNSDREKSSKRILLVGDSHADSLKPILYSLSVSTNSEILVWTGPACSFRIVNGHPKDLCDKRNAAVIAQLEEEKFDLVIVAFRSTQLIPSMYSDRISYLNDISAALSLVRSYVGRIVVVLPSPEYRPVTIWQLKGSNSISRLLPGAFQDRQYFLEVVGDDFNYIDSIAIFCSSSYCYGEDGLSKSPLIDLDHLTTLGAEAYVYSLERVLMSDYLPRMSGSKS